MGGGAGIHHCPESCQKFQQSKNKIRNNICQTEKLRDENAARKAKRKMSLKKKKLQHPVKLSPKTHTTKSKALHSNPSALFFTFPVTKNYSQS